jgi:hypothetical protein
MSAGETDELGLIAFADGTRREMTLAFRGDAEGELFAWLTIGQRREAMITEAYAARRVERHLVQLARRLAPPGAVLDAIRRALEMIEAQETEHERHFASVIRRIAGPLTVAERAIGGLRFLQGRVEGIAVASLVSPAWTRRLAARGALAIAARVEQPPPFIGAIAKIDDFSSFCRLNLDLERTAVASYERMGVLIESIARGRFDPASSITATVNHRVLLDEKLHVGLFRLMSEWTAGSRATAPIMRLAPNAIEGRMAELRRRIYGSGFDDMAWPFGTRRVEAALSRDPLIALLAGRARRSKLKDALAAMLESALTRVLPSLESA